MSDIEPPLSFEGIRRREDILRLAQTAARYRRRRRIGFRCVGAALATGLVLLLVLRVPHKPQRDTKPIAIVPPASRPAPVAVPNESKIVITWVQTDPTILSRLAIPPQKPTWQRLTDDELLDQLAAAGRPAGLAYVNGHALLLFRQPTGQ